MSPFSPHWKGILMGLVLLTLLGLLVQYSWNGQRLASPALIAVEHRAPLTVKITLSTRDGLRLIDVTHDGRDRIFLSVPVEWERTEVRGVPLQTIRTDPPALGFRRFTLPVHAGVSFRAQGTWQKLRIENPSHIPLTVKLTTVDLDRNSAEHEVYLMKEGPLLVP